MSEAPQPEQPADGAAPGDRSVSAGGESDALPVLATRVRIVPPPAAAAPSRRPAGTMIPAAQAAAVAAGGFVAGAAIVGLVHRRHRRPATAKGRGARRGGRAAELVQIVGSRSLLVDVHLLGGPGAGR